MASASKFKPGRIPAVVYKYFKQRDHVLYLIWHMSVGTVLTVSEQDAILEFDFRTSVGRDASTFLIWNPIRIINIICRVGVIANRNFSSSVRLSVADSDIFSKMQV